MTNPTSTDRFGGLATDIDTTPPTAAEMVATARAKSLADAATEHARLIDQLADMACTILENVEHATPDPDWGDVGSLNEALRQLTEIVPMTAQRVAR